MTKSILMDIQTTIIQYANIISQITQAQVEIMDKNYIRIAGTGSYSAKIGEGMKQSSQICQQILQTSESIIVNNPRKHPACINCPNLNNCNEKLIIASPIKFNGGIEGAISLFAITEKEESRLLEKLNVYQNFIEQIADFISIKAKECNAEQINKMYTDTLASIVDKIEQCVIVLNENRSIRSFNSSAKKYLKLSNKCIGDFIVLKSTGDGIHGENEYKMRIDGNRYYIVGQLHKMFVGTQSSVQILIFREYKQLASNSYDLSSNFEILDIDSIIGNSDSTMKLKHDIGRIANQCRLF